MDNNFNGVNGQPSNNTTQQYNQQPQMDMNAYNQQYTQQPQTDMNAYNQQYTQQPQMDMNAYNQQYTQQPQMDMNAYNQQYTQQPQMDMNAYNQQYTQQPQMNAYNQQYTQQPQMNAYNQQYAQQPQMGTNGMNPIPGAPVDGGKPKKVKKPLSKKAIGGIIGGGVAAVAAVVCGIIFIPKLFKSDREVVIDAFKNTFVASGDAADYQEELLGLEDLAKNIEDNGVSYKSTYSVTLGSDNFEISTDGEYDKKNKQLSYELDSDFDGASLFDANFIADDANTYVQLPDLIDGYFTFANSGALDALCASELGEELGLSESGLSGDVNYFPEEGKDGDGDVVIDSALIQTIDDTWDKVKFEKKKKQKIDVNGTTIAAREYDVTLSEEDFENLLTACVDASSENLDALSAALDEEGMSESDVQSSLDQIKSMIPSIVAGDVVVKVYIKDDKVVKVAATDDVNILGVSISYDAYIGLTDDLEAKFEVGAAGESVGISADITSYNNTPNGTVSIYAADESIDLTIKTVDKSDDNNIVKEASYEIAENDYTLAVANVESSIDKTNNTFEINGSIGEDSETDALSFTVSGGYKDVVKGQSYTAEYDASFTVDDDTYGYSGSVSVSSQPQAASIDSSIPLYDITTMTSDELLSVMDDNEEKIDEWMSTLAEVAYGAEAIEEDVEEDIEEDYDDYEEDEDLDEDEPILQGMYSDIKVEILGSLDGFTQDYACEYFVDYYDEDYNEIEYLLEEETNPQDLIEEQSYYDEESVTGTTDVATATISDGAEITYKVISYEDEYSSGSNLYAARAIDDSNVLYILVDLPDGADPVAYLEALNSQYFSVQ